MSKDGFSNFKFFDCIQLDPQAGVADVAVGAVTTSTIDRQGYETLVFGWMHPSIISVGSIADQIAVMIEHASNSTTGVNDVGAFSYCEATDIYGFDMYRCMSDLTIDSWKAQEDLTRTNYPMSIPAYASVTSGTFTLIGISVTSQASCKTASFVPVVEYKGMKRWVRLIFSASTTAGSADIQCFAIQGSPGNWPVNIP